MSSAFNKYLEQFVKGCEDPKLLTHLAFCGKGKYRVPDEKYEEFYKNYFTYLKKNESMYLIEKINENCKFAFFLDIETPKKLVYKIKINDIKLIINKSIENIEKMFLLDNEEQNNYIITKRNDKYHVNFPNLIVNTFIAQRLCKIIIENLEGDIKKLIDTSVYRTGLRLFGSKKSEIEIKKEKESFEESELNNYSSVYDIYDIDNDKCFKLEDTKWLDFMKLVIRRKQDTEL